MAAVAEPTLDDRILERLAGFSDDPEGFVHWAFPWGEPGELEREDGPDDWQAEELRSIGLELEAGAETGCIILRAIRSGHGVGKSALVAWLILWAISTKRLTRGVVTAMTDTQLRTKTWAELATWHNRFIARHLFALTATRLTPDDAAAAPFWRIDAVPWNEVRSSSFAGLHNKGNRLVVLYDEASEIHDRIWEVTEGALTDTGTQILWLVLGNMTQTSGRFFKCFSSERWKSRTVDSRSSRFSNKALIERWKQEYGEDSDFFRVRVRGLPPRAGVSNFIGPDLVFAARKREVRRADYAAFPVEIGVDPARFGDDLSTIVVRQGAKLHSLRTYSGMDGGTLASRVVDTWRAWENVSAIGVDAIGIGASVVDFLTRVPGCPVVSVNVATSAVKDEEYYNLRAELHGKMRKWLETAEIPDDDMLDEELCATNYSFDGKSRIQLEAKQDVKERLGRSPDRADGLALTFVAGTMQSAGRARHAKALPVKRRLIHWGAMR